MHDRDRRSGCRSLLDGLSGRRAARLLTLIVVLGGGGACVQKQPATDVSDPGFPFGPSAIGVRQLAYIQDIKPILDRDCTECHSARDTRGNYSVATYADVMAGQRAGDARSSLVVDCAPGGSMYRYFSGDAATKATEIFRWMVVYDAAQTR